MNCMLTFLKCSTILSDQCSTLLTDPTAELEEDKLSEMLSEKCEDLLKKKHHPKRFEFIDKYTRNEIMMLDEEIPSPNVEHLLEVAIDKVLGDIHL